MTYLTKDRNEREENNNESAIQLYYLPSASS